MAAILPTKGNLMAAKRSRALARTGYELMDRKRNILIRELMGLMDTAKQLQDQIDTVFTEAYEALHVANIRLGICDRIAEAVDVDETLESPFQWKHLKRAFQYIGRHRFQMIGALALSVLATVPLLIF